MVRHHFSFSILKKVGMIKVLFAFLLLRYVATGCNEEEEYSEKKLTCYRQDPDLMSGWHFDSTETDSMVTTIYHFPFADSIYFRDYIQGTPGHPVPDFGPVGQLFWETHGDTVDIRGGGHCDAWDILYSFRYTISGPQLKLQWLMIPSGTFSPQPDSAFTYFHR